MTLPGYVELFTAWKKNKKSSANTLKFVREELEMVEI